MSELGYIPTTGKHVAPSLPPIITIDSWGTMTTFIGARVVLNGYHYRVIQVDPIGGRITMQAE